MATEVETDIDETKMASKLAGNEVKDISMALIEKSEVALRDVDVDTEDFMNLKASIVKLGVLNSILVKRIPLPGTDVVKYALIDGLQRYTASLHAGIDTIPARIVDMDEGEILEAQVITNVNRIITKPAQYALHLVRMLTRNPAWTIDDLAGKVSQSRTWVEKTLSLLNLTDEIKKLVNEGRIKVSNAYALSKLPREEQQEHVQAAISEPHNIFLPRMQERIDEIKKAKKEGRSVEKVEWKPTKSLRKAGDIKTECEYLINKEFGKSSIIKNIEKNELTSPKDVATFVISWVCNFDKVSQEKQKVLHVASVKAKKEETDRRKEEKDKLVEKQAARDAMDLTKF